MQRKTKLIIFSSFLGILIFLLLFYLCCFPIFHNKACNDLESYISGDYKKLGFALKRYGKIASEYLPKYDDIAENSKNVEFRYSSGGMYTKTVDIIVNVEYERSVYLQKKEDIIQAGSDFGDDGHIGNLEERHHILVGHRKMINGEYVYYVISLCDKDNMITYSVMFDTKEYTEFSSLSRHSHPYYNFFREIHTECMQ